MKFLAALLGAAVTVNAAAMFEELDIKKDDYRTDTAPKCLGLGKVCDGLTGPVGTCCPGSFCYQKFPDYFICVERKPEPDPKCLRLGAFCAGFAGPVGTCCPGTFCHYKFPDYATCIRRLPGPSPNEP